MTDNRERHHAVLQKWMGGHNQPFVGSVHVGYLALIELLELAQAVDACASCPDMQSIYDLIIEACEHGENHKRGADALRKINALVAENKARRDSDGSGEADKTGTGLAEGDSAAPEGDRP